MLLARQDLAPIDAVQALVGLQAQAPNPPYLALRCRLQGLQRDAVQALLEDGQLLRAVSLRGTLHWLLPADFAWLRPQLQPVLSRGLQSSHGKLLLGVDLARLAQRARELLHQQGPLTQAELGQQLAALWPNHQPAELGTAARCLLPLVQQPPAGRWDHHLPARLAVFEQVSDSASEALDRLVLRYLAAFGPASIADLQTWCGLTGLQATVIGLGERLLCFQDEQGRRLYDLPEAPRPDAATAVPPRLLGEWDNILLSHADRSRFLDEALHSRVFTRNGIVRGTALVDGRVAGIWRLERERAGTGLTIEAFCPWPKPVKRALQDEGQALLGFAAPGKPAQLRFATIS